MAPMPMKMRANVPMASAMHFESLSICQPPVIVPLERPIGRASNRREGEASRLLSSTGRHVIVGTLGERQRMAIQNRIIKVQKRNRALVSFDEERICKAVLRAADSI